ncbi:hypothetical protein M408DRAFT_21905 [Serendipita vermifera MAFF 305830]|uniref:General transcription and DNA repair factor IIH subunit TFB4 n=1 Tax=Serendipita vermifera MAFF 305830 TaxID=933852 RepID=A0A0C2WW40_SERVB|nr:hypothetical protein M408DRAFT_21905 [Serendipita vermifera MAFF 305830]
MESASHLSIIIDFSPQQWHSSSSNSDQGPFSLASFLPQLFIFLNAHLASQHENTLTIVGAFPGKSSVLFSSNEASTEADADPKLYQPFRTVNAAVVQRLSEELESLPESTDAPIALVGALTKSLCYINRLVNPQTVSSTTQNTTLSSAISPRILIFSVSPDLSASYIPIMNSIFCAQKLKVSLDVCKLYGPDTVFLQQAAHLTGGSYLSIHNRDTLIHYLMICFLSPPAVRQLMAVPTEDKVDFRAACFCHKTIVDIGFICSVCLSIFCKPTPVCSTCRAKFPMKSLTRLKEALKPVLPPGIPEPSPIIDSLPDTAPALTLPGGVGMSGGGKGKGKASQARGGGQYPPLHLGPMGMEGPPNGMHHGMPPGGIMPPGMGMGGMGGGRPGPPLKKGQKRSMNGMPQGMMSGVGMPPGGGHPQMDWRSMMAYPPGTAPASTGTTPTPPPPSR